MQLNSWEKDEYPGSGWVKFVGTDGNVTTSGDDAADNQEGSGARVDGFLNVDTKQVEFIVDYNMMNVRTETFLQEIDKSRIDRFEEEFAQYEKDLEEAKKEQGQGLTFRLQERRKDRKTHGFPSFLCRITCFDDRQMKRITAILFCVLLACMNARHNVK